MFKFSYIMYKYQCALLILFWCFALNNGIFFSKKGVCTSRKLVRINETEIKYTTEFFCCKGYKLSKNYCAPICTRMCIQSACTAPETCSCKKGYVLDPKNKYMCNPKCARPCLHGRCILPETCMCNRGFAMDSENAYKCNKLCTIKKGSKICTCDKGYNPIQENSTHCSPICATPCENSECTSPDFCSCHHGYIKNSTNKFRCEPTCRTPCANGYCSAPNFCTCNEGYALDSNDKLKCVPACSCSNGACIEGDCVCNEGYEKQDNVCTPKCSKQCENGFCSAPESCTCDIAYSPNEESNWICNPTCTKPCANGFCEAPETCSCNPGFTLDSEDKYFCKSNVINCEEGYKEEDNLCVPICTNCINGKCDAPNTCECNEGFVKNEAGECQEKLSNAIEEETNNADIQPEKQQEEIVNVEKTIKLEEGINEESPAKEDGTLEINATTSKASNEESVEESQQPSKEKVVTIEATTSKPIIATTAENNLQPIKEANVLTIEAITKATIEETVEDNLQAVKKETVTALAVTTAKAIIQETVMHENLSPTIKVEPTTTIASNRKFSPNKEEIVNIEPATSQASNVVSSKQQPTKEEEMKVEASTANEEPENYQPTSPKEKGNFEATSTNVIEESENQAPAREEATISSESKEESNANSNSVILGEVKSNVIKEIPAAPICSKPCINAVCSSPEICTCIEGFTPDLEDKYLCKSNEITCNQGFALEQNVCKPICSTSCTNAICTSPEVCTCQTGYILDRNDKFLCNPCVGSQCSSNLKESCEDKCVNGKCDGGQCICNPGEELVDFTCRPICSASSYFNPEANKCDECPDGCFNGRCVDKICVCNEDFTGINCNITGNVTAGSFSWGKTGVVAAAVSIASISGVIGYVIKKNWKTSKGRATPEPSNDLFENPVFIADGLTSQPSQDKHRSWTYIAPAKL